MPKYLSKEMSKLSNSDIKLSSSINSIEFLSNRNGKNFQDLFVKEIFPI